MADPTSVQQVQTGFAPEIAPYGQALLGQGAFYTNPATNPYMQYQGSQVAGFTPMQQPVSYTHLTLPTNREV